MVEPDACFVIVIALPLDSTRAFPMPISIRQLVRICLALKGALGDDGAPLFAAFHLRSSLVRQSTPILKP